MFPSANGRDTTDAMSYAGDRFCWDADSHLMPDAESLAMHADPAFREEMWILGGKNGGEKFDKQFGRMLEKVRARLAEAEKTAELETRVISTAKGWDAHGAVDPVERSRTLDLLGFQGQLVFSTFAGRYRFAKDPDLMYAGARAHARAMAAFCEADERLMAVTMIPLDDPQRALAELNEALRLGVSAVHPFPFEDVGWLMRNGGEELFLFSSDYPHPEGGRDPIKNFETSLDEAGVSPAARQRFYRTNFEEVMRIGGA